MLLTNFILGTLTYTFGTVTVADLLYTGTI